MLLRQLIFPFVWYRGIVFIGHFCVVRTTICLSDRMLASCYHKVMFWAIGWLIKINGRSHILQSCP